ncbi:unnamed protein product [Heterobilharzia americana]|nr:unnamed protein product [Heterobilharzia americana]
MLVPKFVEKKDELQNNHQRKLRKSRNENIFTLFQSPREKVLSEDNSYRGRNTSESCIFYLRFGSRRLIGPFIFHPQINPEQNQFTDIFLQTGKINAFNPKDLLYMRNRREIPVSKVQITDQILDAAYDLERYILDQTKRSQYSMNRPFVDHNLTQIINDLIGNTQFTITATPVVQNELFVKNSGENYKQQMNNLYRILDSLREQVSELKEENRSLHAQLEVYTNCKNNERHCIERNNERMNESTFAWHARLNALLDQYRAENEALKKLAQSPTQCPLHPTGQRTHFKNPYNEDYRVNECPKYSLHNRRDQDFSPSNPEQTRVKRVRICSGQHSSRLPRLNIPGQTVNIPIKKIKKPEIQVSNIPRSTAYAKQHTNKQTTNNKSHTVTNMSK